VDAPGSASSPSLSGQARGLSIGNVKTNDPSLIEPIALA
jgi:hypothetical protein